VAVASGQSIKAWAREHDIPVRTCYLWTHRPEFKAKVESIRNRITDRAVGELTRSRVQAVREMGRLSTKAQHEPTRLAACRAVVADLAALKNQDLARRVEALETALREHAGTGKKDRPA